MTAYAHDTITSVTPPPALHSCRRRSDDRVGVAEADRVPVADPQGLQARLVAAAGGRRHRGLADHRSRRRRVHRSVAPRLAAGPAVSGRRLVAADHRGLADHAGNPGARLPRRPRPPPDVGGRLGPPDHRPPGGRVRRAGPGRPPGRTGAGRPGVGVAELRHHRRARRQDGLGADHLRRPPVGPPGPHRPGPHPRARRGPAASPRKQDPGRRNHPRHRPPLAPRVHPRAWRVRPAHGDRGLDRQREDEPDDPAVGGLVHRHPASIPGRERGTGRCWWCWTARAAGTPAARPTAPAACSTPPAPAASPSGRTRPGFRCGTCRPRIWRCCCTR